MRRCRYNVLGLSPSVTNGVSVCQALRSQGDLPTISITACSETADVIAGLEAGAGAYVTKPLVASEFAAKIRALRRPHRQQTPTWSDEVDDRLRIGGLGIFPTRPMVCRADGGVHLARTEFRLMVELSSAAGKTVTREKLLEHIWGHDYYGGTRMLDVQIRRLRQTIEANPDSPEMVVTVRGVRHKTGES